MSFERFTGENAAMLLVDHQVGTMGWVIADAGGSPSKMGDDMALRRMEKGGVTLSSTNQVIAEPVGSWSAPEGKQRVQVMVEALNS
nr:hypothetical protein [Leisingera thetidis]